MDADLERRVLRGLHLEWELAVAALPAAVRARMARPIFRLADMGPLGLWSPSKREIAVQRRLAAAAPWDDVREVLRHETAHQLAAVLEGPGQAPHGEAFARACRLLGARPEASMRHTPLHARLAAEARTPEEDPLRRRVAKLLALAESANPHEARAAMVKARELMRQQRRERLAHPQPLEFVSAFLGAPALRHPQEAYVLAHLIQDFFFVEGIWVPAYVVARGRMGRALEVSGEAHHLEMAGYVHDCVRRFIERQWRETRGAGRGRRRSDFAVGVIEGFRRQLDAPAPGAPEAGALMVLKDPRLDAYLRQRYPRRRRFSRGGGQRDHQAYAEGWQQGRRFVLARGVSRRETAPGGRLPAPEDGD